MKWNFGGVHHFLWYGFKKCPTAKTIMAVQNFLKFQKYVGYNGLINGQSMHLLWRHERILEQGINKLWNVALKKEMCFVNRFFFPFRLVFPIWECSMKLHSNIIFWVISCHKKEIYWEGFIWGVKHPLHPFGQCSNGFFSMLCPAVVQTLQFSFEAILYRCSLICPL